MRDNSCQRISFFCIVKILFIGIIIGSIFSVVWQELFSPFISNTHSIIHNKQVDIYKKLNDVALLEYINGKWVSSGEEMIIFIDNKIEKSILVFVSNNNNTKKYDIISVDDVDSIFGIVKLTICDKSKECSPENRIPIQINRIFGVERTINISYDSRIVYCLQVDDLCTRAFKRKS